MWPSNSAPCNHHTEHQWGGGGSVAKSLEYTRDFGVNLFRQMDCRLFLPTHSSTSHRGRTTHNPSSLDTAAVIDCCSRVRCYIESHFNSCVEVYTSVQYSSSLESLPCNFRLKSCPNILERIKPSSSLF